MTSSDRADSLPGVPFDPRFREAPWRVRPLEPKDADYLFKHTEGWVIVPDDHFDFPVGFFIATNDPRYGELFARIAAAGPELLAACQMALDWWNLDTRDYVARYGERSSSRDVGDVIRAALAKAEASS